MTSPLFERQSTGGVVARDGFGYQDAFLLQNIPNFLSQGAFSHAVSELLGDIEVRYHRPNGGTFCTLYEAKRNQLTKSKLWEEVARFRELHDSAPDEYVRFVLVCGDFNSEFVPLIRKLERYRGPGDSLNFDSSVRASAAADIEASIVSLGQSIDAARFVLQHVSFLKYSDADMASAFVRTLSERLPAMADMRGSEITAFGARCKAMVEQSTRGTITRAAIEDALTESAPSLADAWLAMPTKILFTQATSGPLEELTLEVGQFNGDSRGSLTPTQWGDLQNQLSAVGQFVLSSRKRHGLQLSAKQRMSLACTIGYCFSATRGFTLQMEHNGQILDTATHARSDDKFFVQRETEALASTEAGVVCIGFPTPGEADMLAAAEALGLGRAPTLILTSSAVIPEVRVMNVAVNEAKSALVAFRARNRISRLHLFVKAPSSYAMSLGHRLNGVGVVQLYDWIGDTYLPTAQLS